VNAIVNGCRPYKADAEHRGPCGDYWIDLTQNSFMEKVVNKFPVGTSCTYRVTSKCGYPIALPNIRNEIIAADFNIAYAAIAGIDASDELNGWEFLTTMDMTGSYQTGSKESAYKIISDGPNKPKIGNINTCRQATQNLYVVIVRT
jgi:hypothetical protein